MKEKTKTNKETDKQTKLLALLGTHFGILQEADAKRDYVWLNMQAFY